MYEVRCFFCKRVHASEFFDEIEEQILACRDQAPGWQKGTVDGLRQRVEAMSCAGEPDRARAERAAYAWWGSDDERAAAQLVADGP